MENTEQKHEWVSLFNKTILIQASGAVRGFRMGWQNKRFEPPVQLPPPNANCQ
jgi:hypothetical protein